MEQVGIKKVKVVENISDDELFNQIFINDEPVIFKGLVKNWPIVKAAQHSYHQLYDYLKKIDSKTQHPVTSFEADKGINGRYFYQDSLSKFNFDRYQESFSATLERIFGHAVNRNSNKTAYAACIESIYHTTGFEDENPRPFNIPKNVTAKMWIGNEATISTHFDMTDNIVCAVSGKRTFTLFPMSQIKNLYPAPFEKSVSGTPMSTVDINNPDFEKHPRYKEALEHALVAELEPGDGLFVPNLWWHNVRSEGSFCMMVNYFWIHDQRKMASPINFLLHGLFTLSHLEESDKNKWKEIIDYFVFKQHGDPMAHIANAERGMFGEITPEHVYDLRDYMVRSMGYPLADIKKGKYS